MSKYYAGKRRDGIAKIFKGDDSGPHIQQELDPARSLLFRNHSPTGLEWGSNFIRQMNFDVTVRAEQFKVLRIGLQFPDRNRSLFPFTSTKLFVGWFQMVKMEGSGAPSISTFRAPTTEGQFDGGALAPFAFTPFSLRALGAEVLPSFIADIRKAFAASFAKPWAFEINTRAIMLTFTGDDLATSLAPKIGETAFAITSSSISTVGDSGFTFNAEDWRIRTHPTKGYRKLSVNQCLSENDDGGPAQLSLAILLDFSDDAEWAMEHYQEFKADVVSRMPQGEDWELRAIEIFMWVQHREEAKKHFAAKWDGARAQLVEEK